MTSQHRDAIDIRSSDSPLLIFTAGLLILASVMGFLIWAMQTAYTYY